MTMSTKKDTTCLVVALITVLMMLAAFYLAAKISHML